MPVDASIALGAKPVQLPDFNNLALERAQIMNYMSEQATRQRALTEQRNLANVVRTPGFDPSNPEHQRAVLQAAPNLGPAALEKFGQLREQSAKAGAAEVSLRMQKQLAAVQQFAGMTDPSQARSMLEKSKADGSIPPEAADAIESQIPADAAGMPAFVQKMIYRAVAQTKPELAGQQDVTTVDQGDNKRIVRAPSLMGSGVNPTGTNYAVAPSPEANLTAATARRGQDITAGTASRALVANQLSDQAKLDAWKPMPGSPDTLYNDQGQFRVGAMAQGSIPSVSVFGPVPTNAMAPAGALPKNVMVAPNPNDLAGAPLAPGTLAAAPPSLAGVPAAAPAPKSAQGVVPVTTQGLEGKTLPEVQDAMSARRSLAKMGYGSPSFDAIRTMIQNSKGGSITDMTNQALAHLDKSSPEAQAIQQLSTIIPQLVLAQTGGKLGSGISDADTNLLKQGFGDIANVKLPAATRLKAWDTVVSTLERNANYEARTAGGATAPKPGQRLKYDPATGELK